jgi:hypothetical protein
VPRYGAIDVRLLNRGRLAVRESAVPELPGMKKTKKTKKKNICIPVGEADADVEGC